MYVKSLPFRIWNSKKLTIGKECIISNCNIKGNGRVIIGNNARVYDCVFHFEDGENTVSIGDCCLCKGVFFIERKGGKNLISIGSNTTIPGQCQIEASENNFVSIGDDCMFSHDIRIWAASHHSILNSDGLRINPAKSIRVGNHCWIGHSVFILKGAVVPDGSIVGVNSLYNKVFTKSNAIYAGIPAQIIKENISWCRPTIPFTNTTK